ncbi:type II secretion system F family protein [Methanolobus halotolerans]|uniref:Secretion system protein n=1 Tax=Methanolobus halotolerans TaxID=2052935 RepID=A0A4E0PYI3_9EURY|nr:type II secretion system F family protein [Methanolobus halotolerans]TGC08735.1 secretion system protein [Methanolobus halotolerans]
MTENKNSSEIDTSGKEEFEIETSDGLSDSEPETIAPADKQAKKKRKTGFAVDPYIKKASLYFNIVKRIPFILLGTRIKARKQNYVNLQKQLNQARIPISHEMYISNAVFYSVLAGILGAFLGLFLTYVIIGLIGLPENITKLTFTPSMAFLLQYKEIFLAFFITIVFVVGLGGLVYTIFVLYPGFQAGERKTKIDMQLPYAVTFMYALSKGGMNIIDVFKALARSEDTYGEVSKEIDSIVRDMEYFGHDLRTALTNASEITPSDRFQDLIYNLLTVIDSGGNIPNYFRDKSEQYLIKSEVDQKGFLETLALLAESYVTAFVAGPLFIIIMGVMMAVMGSGSSTMVYAIIYAVLPVGSLMFVVMISIITPTEMGEPELLGTNTVLDHGIPDIPAHLAPAYDENGELIGETEEKVRERDNFESFTKSKKSLTLRGIIKDPLAPMFQNPLATLAITVPLALIIVIGSAFLNADRLGNLALIVEFIDDKIVFAILLIIIPLSVFYEIKQKKKKKLESSFPDFLKKLASTNETGMTLRDSIRLMARSDTDALSSEIKKIWHDVFWGLEVNDSLIRFANRLRTQVVTRSLSLITKANESSGDIGEVLMVAARDAASEQGMKRERNMSMMIYIVIIYISFLVFVGVIFVISTTFLTEMAQAGKQMAESGSSAGGFLGSFDMEAYTQLFKHAAIIQGLSSGLMAGAMGEGSIMAGLKHSTIMMIIGYVIFTLFI